MFREGDEVNIIYTGKEYTAGIPESIIHGAIRNNPYIVTIVGNDWAALEGNGYYWSNEMLQYTIPKEPDWEI